MSAHTVTLELPESLYRSARRVAEATRRPLADVVLDSLSHNLPPLDDLPADQVEELARLSSLEDGDLWREAQSTLSPEEQSDLEALLEAQGSDGLKANEQARLDALMDAYGRSLVRKSHAWLLLARRGYRVPVQD